MWNLKIILQWFVVRRSSTCMYSTVVVDYLFDHAQCCSSVSRFRSMLRAVDSICHNQWRRDSCQSTCVDAYNSSNCRRSSCHSFDTKRDVHLCGCAHVASSATSSEKQLVTRDMTCSHLKTFSTKLTTTVLIQSTCTWSILCWRCWCWCGGGDGRVEIVNSELLLIPLAEWLLNYSLETV